MPFLFQSKYLFLRNGRFASSHRPAPVQNVVSSDGGRHANEVSVRNRAGELGVGRADVDWLASLELPPRIGGRSPRRGVATCGKARVGPGLRLLLLLLLLNTLISLKIIIVGHRNCVMSFSPRRNYTFLRNGRFASVKLTPPKRCFLLFGPFCCPWAPWPLLGPSRLSWASWALLGPHGSPWAAWPPWVPLGSPWLP